MLRDDLIHPLVSGNKWRKLKYIIRQMQESGKNKLVSFGGAYSNHLVAAAVSGRHFGIETIGFVRGNETRALNAFETCCMDHGMKLIHVDRSTYRDKEALFEQYFGHDPGAEFVGEGGRHPMALQGCAEIIDALEQTYDYIVLSLGTGTTMEGLVKRVSELQLNSVITGISSLKGNKELDRIMEQYPRVYWQIEHDYHRGKYARNDAELTAFIQQFHQETSIRLEHVYTGKMMMALQDMLNSGKIVPGKRILCIHTGGVPFLLNQ